MTIEEFAQYLLQKYDGTMDAGAHRAAHQDYVAREFEIAAISVVEMAPVTDTELSDLLDLARDFDWVDAEVAQRVVAKIRATRDADG